MGQRSGPELRNWQACAESKGESRLSHQTDFLFRGYLEQAIHSTPTATVEKIPALSTVQSKVQAPGASLGTLLFNLTSSLGLHDRFSMARHAAPGECQKPV